MVFVFGRTPLFYFLFHFLLLHLLTFPLGLFRYGKVDFLWVPAPSMAGIPWRLRLRTANRICHLGLIVIAMYPLCRWYANRKA